MRQGIFASLGRCGGALGPISAISVVVLQHPPTMRVPAATHYSRAALERSENRDLPSAADYFKPLSLSHSLISLASLRRLGEWPAVVGAAADADGDDAGNRHRNASVSPARETRPVDSSHRRS